MEVANACRVQEHALLPNETVYTHVYFPLDLDEDLYIVGFSTKVVNAVHLHHFVVYLCTVGIDELYDDPTNPAGFPQQPAKAEDNGAPVPCGASEPVLVLRVRRHMRTQCFLVRFDNVAQLKIKDARLL